MRELRLDGGVEMLESWSLESWKLELREGITGMLIGRRFSLLFIPFLRLQTYLLLKVWPSF